MLFGKRRSLEEWLTWTQGATSQSADLRELSLLNRELTQLQKLGWATLSELIRCQEIEASLVQPLVRLTELSRYWSQLYRTSQALTHLTSTAREHEIKAFQDLDQRLPDQSQALLRQKLLSALP